MVATFCGHSEVENEKAVRQWLQKTVESLVEQGVDKFYLGGYGGFDRMAAAVVREAKKRHPQICSTLVLPYMDHKLDTAVYDNTVYPPLETVPKRYAIVKRNEYMVDWADVVVAFVLYSGGGAAATLRYAERKKKRIIRYMREDK